MKYAKLVKLGGELIEAKDADYQDYYGILTCPECGEPVFLRKGHQRGETVFRAAFVHHRAIPEVSACEMRVGKYSQEYVARVAGEARNQRLRMLEESMWEYLNTSPSINYLNHSFATREAKTNSFEKRVFKELEKLFINDGILLKLLKKFSFEEFTSSLRWTGNNSVNDVALGKFLDTRQKDWTFHQRLAAEALEVFLGSILLKKVRHRWMACLCHRSTLADATPRFFSLELFSREWLELLFNYAASTTALAFLTVDWIEVLNVNKEETRKTRGFAPVSKG